MNRHVPEWALPPPRLPWQSRGCCSSTFPTMVLDRHLRLAGPQEGSWMAHTPSRSAGPEQRVLEGDLAEIRLERWGCEHHLIYFLFEEKEDAENPFFFFPSSLWCPCEYLLKREDGAGNLPFCCGCCFQRAQWQEVRGGGGCTDSHSCSQALLCLRASNRLPGLGKGQAYCFLQSQETINCDFWEILA